MRIPGTGSTDNRHTGRKPNKQNSGVQRRGTYHPPEPEVRNPAPLVQIEGGPGHELRKAGRRMTMRPQELAVTYIQRSKRRTPDRVAPARDQEPSLRVPEDILEQSGTKSLRTNPKQ